MPEDSTTIMHRGKRKLNRLTKKMKKRDPEKMY